MTILARMEVEVCLDTLTIKYLKTKMKEQGWLCNSLMLDPDRCTFNFDTVTIDEVGTMKLSKPVPSMRPIYVSIVRSWITGNWHLAMDYRAGISDRHLNTSNDSIRQHVKIKPRRAVT